MRFSDYNKKKFLVITVVRDIACFKEVELYLGINIHFKLYNIKVFSNKHIVFISQKLPNRF